jgi:hypothetical protein
MRILPCDRFLTGFSQLNDLIQAAGAARRAFAMAVFEADVNLPDAGVVAVKPSILPFRVSR